MKSVVLDTNVFVAAGFSNQSHSARIINQVRRGELTMPWSAETRDEIRYILKKVPVLAWDRVADLFGDRDRYAGALDPDRYEYIDDPADRWFLALAEATGSALVSHDDHLLAHAARATVPVLTPTQFYTAEAA
jgi:predicted nucleic acid-binding protein